MKPTEQFFKWYESLLECSDSAKDAYEKAERMFFSKYEYSLYSSYESFKSSLSRRRKQIEEGKQVNNVYQLHNSN